MCTIAVVHHRYAHFQPAARAARWHVGRTRGGGFFCSAACWPRRRRVLTHACGAPSATLRGWYQPKDARAQWVSRWTRVLQVALNHVPGAFVAEPTLIALHGCAHRCRRLFPESGGFSEGGTTNRSGVPFAQQRSWRHFGGSGEPFLARWVDEIRCHRPDLNLRTCRATRRCPQRR